MNKQKWLTLSIVGMALLLLPRRSSWQQNSHTKNLSEKGTSKKDNSKTTSPQQTDLQHQNCDKNK
ncbi:MULTISPECIES: hypothetical protein [unclassified Psychrobacter]|uniref:hypothetical protein n=1 Tax=unclassified Psychrobacter TaxID=196806 RepID=UPI00071E7E80|nr:MULTISPECIES: hypothetical protein [unclassified Psychrobacter]OLF39082.1 hypothetical protein BTV98_01290 [Psychrobacter sp. Cmf 22.2]